MKILVAEDNLTNRILLRKILQKANYQVLEAENGLEAFNILKQTKIDAVLIDWMMPKLNGIELVQRIRRSIKPLPVTIFVTALSSEEAKEKALNSGADDYIAKPIDRNDLLERLANLLHIAKVNIPLQTKKISHSKQIPDFLCVCFAASTGGPPTLKQIFSKIEATKKAVFLIVLHGPDWMLESFSERLSRITEMPVSLAKDKMEITPGRIIICPGNYHMVINSEEMEINLSDAPPVNFIKPAADPLFESVSKKFRSKSIGVILTGMGRDGTIGAGYIKAAEGTIIVQDPKSATLPAMPQSVIDLRITGIISPLNKLAETINKAIERVY